MSIAIPYAVCLHVWHHVFQSNATWWTIPPEICPKAPCSPKHCKQMWWSMARPQLDLGNVPRGCWMTWSHREGWFAHSLDLTPRPRVDRSDRSNRFPKKGFGCFGAQKSDYNRELLLNLIKSWLIQYSFSLKGSRIAFNFCKTLLPQKTSGFIQGFPGPIALHWLLSISFQPEKLFQMSLGR